MVKWCSEHTQTKTKTNTIILYEHTKPFLFSFSLLEPETIKGDNNNNMNFIQCALKRDQKKQQHNETCSCGPSSDTTSICSPSSSSWSMSSHCSDSSIEKAMTVLGYTEEEFVHIQYLVNSKEEYHGRRNRYKKLSKAEKVLGCYSEQLKKDKGIRTLGANERDIELARLEFVKHTVRKATFSHAIFSACRGIYDCGASANMGSRTYTKPVSKPLTI